MSGGGIQVRTNRPKPYRARYRAADGSERSRSFRLKADAQAWLTDQTADLQRGAWTDPRQAKIMFSEQLERYLEAQRHLAPSTQAARESLVKNHVLPFFGPMAISAVRHSDVQAFISDLEAKGKSASTIRQAYLIARGVLEQAVDDGVIARSPVSKPKLPKTESAEHRYLDAGEVDLLVDATAERYQALVLAGAYTGARFGELAGLRISDLDLLARRLTISRSLTEVKGRVSLGPTKTAAGRRQLSLPGFLCDELGRHIGTYPGESGLVFTSATGAPIKRTNFRRRVWLPAVADSVSEPMRFHDLRHTHVAMLIAQGEHPKVIQNRLGHASITTTLDIYGHLFDGLDGAAAARLDEAWTSRAARVRPRGPAEVGNL